MKTGSCLVLKIEKSILPLEGSFNTQKFNFLFFFPQICGCLPEHKGNRQCAHGKRKITPKIGLELKYIRYELDALIVDLHETRALQSRNFL